MGKGNQHMIIHESQIKQQIILRKPTQEKYMNLSTETSLHRNNTWIIQTRTIPRISKQTHNKKSKYQHKYSRKWSSKHEIWGEEIRTHTFFLKIWRWTSVTMEFVESDAEFLGEIQLREKVNSHKKFEGKLKRFKN